MDNSVFVGFTFGDQQVKVLSVPPPPQIANMTEAVVFLASVAAELSRLLPGLMRQQFAAYAKMGQQVAQEMGQANGNQQATPIDAKES